MENGEILTRLGSGSVCVGIVRSYMHTYTHAHCVCMHTHTHTYTCTPHTPHHTPDTQWVILESDILCLNLVSLTSQSMTLAQLINPSETH